MKTVHIRPGDSGCAAPDWSQSETGGQQASHETLTERVIREGRIPSAVRDSASMQSPLHDTMDSFARLESLRKSAGRYLPPGFDPDDERGKALDEKYGFQFTPPHESGVRQCRNSEEIQS